MPRKAAVKVRKPLWLVNLSYTDHHYFSDDHNVDKEIRIVAKRHGGMDGGSGMGFGRRDVGWCFKTHPKALDFKVDLRQTLGRRYGLRIDSIQEEEVW